MSPRVGWWVLSPRVSKWVIGVGSGEPPGRWSGGVIFAKSITPPHLPGDRCPRVGPRGSDPTKINSHILSEPRTTTYGPLHARWVYERKWATAGNSWYASTAPLGAVWADSLEL